MTATETKIATWNIDPVHSAVGFAVKHLMISTVRGRFDGFSGTINFDPSQPGASSVDITIDVASVSTGNEQRDGHLQSADFYDVEHHPSMTFKSTRVESKGDRKFSVFGDLTLRGVTQEVELETTYQGEIVDASGSDRVAFEATTEISRSAFGVNFNAPLGTGGVVVGDAVMVNLDIAAVRATD